jgi:pimeloyl-ACP methyl ester carboxylesterase
MGMPSRLWLPFTWTYRRHFRFYLPDFRGAGLSSQAFFNQADIFQNNMEDVQDLVRHFGLRDFLLAGFSLGASTALHWLRAEGFAGVRRYLHIDQSACIPNTGGWPYGLYGSRQAVMFDGMRQLLAKIEPYSHFDRLTDLPLQVRREILTIFSDMSRQLGAGRMTLGLLSLSAYWSRLLSLVAPSPHIVNAKAILNSYLNAHDYRASLQQCSIPVTFMIGMRSRLYEAQGQMAVARSVPESRLVPFERAGHTLWLHEPSRFRRELGRFLYDE